MRREPIPVLHWFTSDLRVADNAALAAAGAHGAVAGVFVLDPAILRRHANAPRRIAYLHACLAALDTALAAVGSRLVVLEGDSAAALARLAETVGAKVVTHARHHEPAAIAREERVAHTLARAGVDVEPVEARLVQPPGSILTGAGTTFRVYGAFARAWTMKPVAAAAPAPRAWASAAALDRLGRRLAAADVPGVGEAAAKARLGHFIRRGLPGYREGRDIPGIDGTSRLSPALRWGTISAAECVRRVRAAVGRDPSLRDAAATWIGELAWRDFFAHLLVAEPRLAREPMHSLGIRWRHDDTGFRAWQDGRTGYPLVDAGIRQLAATGWMHNRARMLTASFLTRHLLLDWRLGERHFMEQLTDGQLSQNNGNWQWVAGTGADAQPFHRIFSPVRQGERFDPEGTYVKQWVPELARVPARFIHEPWTLGRLERRGLCPDYPPPIVDLDEARGRALAAFETARGRQTTPAARRSASSSASRPSQSR